MEYNSMIATEAHLFPVEEREVFAAGEIAAPTHKAIVRTDTNEVLGIHSTKYQLVPNEVVFPALEEQLGRTFDTNGMVVHNQLDKSGARTLRTYMFPEHKIELLNGDSVAFELRAANSYDASHTFGLMAGGFRFACHNGMVIGSTMANVKRKHTAGLDIDFILHSLNEAMALYNRNGELWKRWTTTYVSHQQAEDIITKAVPGERTQKKLVDQWCVESATLGCTAWALYQALTYWSTHTKGRVNHGTALLQREDTVRKALPQLEALAA